MASNRFAVFTGPGQVELRSESVPEPGRGEALVQIRACGLCTMEQRLWKGTQDDYPIAAGHETAGIVVGLHSEGAFSASVGQRVAIALLDRCMQCESCRRGDSHLCTGKMRDRGPNVFRRIGGLADYAIVPAWKLFPISEDRSFDEIALCEPLACVVHSINKAGLRLGDDVLVVGGGTMGILHLILRDSAARVCSSAIRTPKSDAFALDHGAAGAFRARRGQGKYPISDAQRCADAIFVTFGHQDTALEAMRSARPGGTIIYYAGFPPGVDTGIDARRLHHQEIAILGARGQTLEDWHQASRLLSTGLVDVRPLISARYPLARISEALDRATDGAAYRIIVNP